MALPLHKIAGANSPLTRWHVRIWGAGVVEKEVMVEPDPVGCGNRCRRDQASEESDRPGVSYCRDGRGGAVTVIPGVAHRDVRGTAQAEVAPRNDFLL